MQPLHVSVAMLLTAVTGWLPCTCYGICDIMFSVSNRFPDVICLKFSTPGAPAAMAASKESSVRCRYEGYELQEQKCLPPGAYRYSIKGTDHKWSSWVGYAFSENQDYLFTIEWNNASKSQGKRVNYSFPAFTFTLTEPCKYLPLSYTAKFSTARDFSDYRHVNDISLTCPFVDNAAAGCLIQVWALVTGSLPTNTPAGTKAAFDIPAANGRNAEVRIKSTTNAWVFLAFLPQDNGYVN